MSFLIPESHLEIIESDHSIESDSNEVKLNSRLISMSHDFSGDCDDDEGNVIVDDDDGDVTDLFQSSQVNLITIPSNGNVIQVPSNLLVTSDNSLILCLPPEGITFQVQSTSPLDSSLMETNIHEIYDSSNFNQSSLSSLSSSPPPSSSSSSLSSSSLSSPSFTTLTPITFPDLIEKSTTVFGETIEVSPEIQLEKAQIWHKDSQLAIVALAALKATNN